MSEIHNKIYENNLRSIEGNYQQLYNQFLSAINDVNALKEFEDLYEIQVKTGKKGHPTFSLLRKSDGMTITGHSIFDPFKEAEKKCSDFAFSENERIVQIGFGFGYETISILSKLKHPHVIVIEPFPFLFKKALETVDLRKIFESRKTIITFDTNPKTLKYILTTECNHLNIPKYQVLKLQYSDLANDLIEKISTSIKEIQSFITLNFNTAVGAGAIFQRNLMINFTQTLDKPGITALFEKFKNRPIFVVAPGPSLEKNGHLLKQVMGKELIIACDTATKPLQKMGVKPDIIGSIDFQVLNFYKLRGVDTSQSALAASYDASYFIQADNPGRQFNYFHSLDMNTLFGYLIGSKGIINSGGSVLTDCFSIAIKAGANPLVFVGVDLSFPGDKYYIDGTFDDGASTKKVKNKDFAFIEIEDVFGNKVFTYDSFYNFLTWLGSYIKLTQHIKFIDATEGGAKIMGTEIIPLQEVIDKYVTGDNPSPQETIDSIFESHTAPSYDKLLEESDKFICTFRAMEKRAAKASKTADRALKTIETTPNLQGNSKFITQLKQINQERLFFQSSEVGPQMAFINPLIDKFIASINYYNDDTTIPQKERYTKMMQIEKATFEGIRNSCRAMISHFELIESDLLVRKGDDYV